ncbi:hypothetical protein SALBM135S_02320 [Streptomyces alboniger]
MAAKASTRRQFLSLLGLSAAAVSCGASATATSGGGRTKTLRYQGWTGQVTLPELAADLGFLEDVKLKWVGNTISGPQDIQSAATGQTDFGGAFNGAVVKLAANNAPIKAVISYYGADKDAYNGFYVLKDSPIRSPRDLIGTKVGMNTLGAHSEAMLDIYLRRGGISREDREKVEPLVVPPVNTEQSLRQKQIEVAVLGGVLRDKALAAGANPSAVHRLQTPRRFQRGHLRHDGPLSAAEPRHGPHVRNTALALLPVFVLLLGIGETSKISLVVYACTWPILLNTISAVRNVDPTLLKLARSMDLSAPRLFQKVILPGLVPVMFTGIRLAGAVSVLVLVAAEMIGAKAGLGHLVNASQYNFAIPQMYAGIITISAIGVAFNQFLVAVERRLSSWRVPAGG